MRMTKIYKMFRDIESDYSLSSMERLELKNRALMMGLDVAESVISKDLYKVEELLRDQTVGGCVSYVLKQEETRLCEALDTVKLASEHLRNFNV